MDVGFPPVSGFSRWSVFDPLRSFATSANKHSMEEVLTVEELQSLLPEQQKRAVQDIYAGPEHPLFVGIREAFLDAFPQSRSAEVFCGMAGGLGPMNAIIITTKLGHRLLGLPRSFLGMPVIRRAEGRSGTWLPTGDN